MDYERFARMISPPFGEEYTESLKTLVEEFCSPNSMPIKGELYDVVHNEAGLSKQHLLAVYQATELQRVGLCRKDVSCGDRACRKWMKLQWRKNRYRFVCSNRSRHSNGTSTERGMFVEGSKDASG